MSETLAAVVAVHGVRVGHLERLGDDEDHSFTFDELWANDPDRPCLGQLFEDRRPDPIETSGLPCWFAHLLPQGPFDRLLRSWAELDTDAPDLALLVATGSDLPGAVTLEPATPAALQQPTYAAAIRREGALRFSLAGAQRKLSVREGERGLVIPVAGSAGLFIAKFHDPSFPDLPRVEYATTRWAALAGIRAHACRLARADEFQELPRGLPLGDDTVFLATRFDRTPEGGRVHHEDFGQILDRPPGQPQYYGSYEEIARVLHSIAGGDEQEYVERLAFVIASGNGDAHLKNWGVVYPDRRTPRLSPAYDQVSTAVYPSLPRELALTLGGQRELTELEKGCLGDLARAIERDEAEVSGWFRDAADRAKQAFRENVELELRPSERSAIEALWSEVPLLR